ncbi:MAG: hypothetical protein J6S83_11755 [Lachnospiraceae bacterium]|nr:hypothetical protein [Lachnospiraceae bacterium]
MSSYLTCPEYEQLKKEYIRGWKTWNVNSVFSYVHMPDGLALNLCFKEYRDGNFLRDALIGRFPTDDPEDATEVLFPGDHAADDSYTSMRMKWCGLEVLVESAACEDAFALLVTPLVRQFKPAGVYLQGGYMWNRKGSVQLTDEGMAAHSSEQGQESGGGSWLVKTSAAVPEPDRNIPLTGPFLSAALTGPVGFYAWRQKTGKGDSGAASETSAAGGCKQDTILDRVRALIEEKKSHLAGSYDAYGDLGWMAQAMECAVSWDTVYDANYDRVISPVSRLWSIRKGGYVLFCWDNFFAGYLAGSFSKALAYSNVIEIVNERTQNGFVPNMSCGNGLKTLDRSQPPVGSRMVLELYKKYTDLWLVKLLYPALMEWNTWFWNSRRSPSGAFSWGSDPVPVNFGNRWETDGVNGRFGGALESGLDNSPMYDDIPFDPESHCLMLEDVGLTGLFVMDCEALGELSRLLGKEADSRLLQERRSSTQCALDRLWDEEKGFYYNRRTDTGEYSPRISPTNFYALFSGDIPKARTERILKEHYYNPDEFYGDWMLPSIARNDPAYHDQDYWRGRVWAPMNFLVYLAMEQHHLTEACRDLAGKSENIFRPEWERHRHVHENYNAITGEGCDARNSDKFYHWGALLSAVVLRNRGFL